MGADIAVWLERKKSLSRQTFVEQHRYPFLLKRALPIGGKAESEEEEDFAERLSFHTNVVDTPTGTVPSAGKLAGGLVMPIVKKPENPFPDRVSVGRAQNCDVVIRDPSISKLHGHFRALGVSEADFTDLKSANGTKVNGKLVQSTAVRVVSGDTMIFGSIVVQFLDAKRLWELL